VVAFDLCDLGMGEARRDAPPAARVEDEWAVFSRIEVPTPTRLVRHITTFVRDESGLWRRDDERHENVLVDTSTVPQQFAAHGVSATVGTSFGAEPLPVGMVTVTGRRVGG
jgi:hypothetical protein